MAKWQFLQSHIHFAYFFTSHYISNSNRIVTWGYYISVERSWRARLKSVFKIRIREKPDPEIRFNRFSYCVVFLLLLFEDNQWLLYYRKLLMSPFRIWPQNPDIRKKISGKKNIWKIDAWHCETMIQSLERQLEAKNMHILPENDKNGLVSRSKTSISQAEDVEIENGRKFRKFWEKSYCWRTI